MDRVNDVIIGQLLNDILGNGLNDGEVEEIRSFPNRAAKAGKLIDMLRMKDVDDVSWKFIASLENRDPTLHKRLGLPSASQRQSSQPGELTYFTGVVHK